MLFYLAAVLPGLVYGLVRHGRLEHLAQIREARARALLVLGVGVQVGLFPGPDLHGLQALAPRLAAALVGAFLLANARAGVPGLRRAYAVLVAGWLLNAVPILLEGRMPYDPAAARAAGLDAALQRQPQHLLKHLPAQADALSRTLGDRLPLPPAHLVLSVGDVLLLVGAAMLLAAATAAPRRPPLGRMP